MAKVKSSTASDTEYAAHVGTSAIGMSAVTILRFADIVGEQKPEDLVAELKKRVKAVNDGRMEGVEAMLMGQAIALQSIFANFANRSAVNAGEHMHATETYMKLSLRAQSQCRATLETLATIKNPPLVYARQANVTTGPQQINNGVVREIESVQNQLLEEEHDERLDTRTTSKAGSVDSRVEAVEAVNWAED